MPQEPLLPEPPLTQTQQGVDTYPRVIRQDEYNPSVELVTLALPGLRRARVWVPKSQWLNLEHLAVHDPLVAQLKRLIPPLKPGSELDDM